MTKLEQAFEKAFNEPFDDSHEAACFALGYKAAQPQWVRVSDRLPEKEGEYLVTTIHNPTQFKESTWSMWDGNWDVDSDGSGNKVIAWMPLPEPAK